MHVKIVKFAKNQLSRIQLDMQKIIKITKCRKGEVGGGGGGGGGAIKMGLCLHTTKLQYFLSDVYRKNFKIWDTSNNCHNCPKNRKV